MGYIVNYDVYDKKGVKDDYNSSRNVACFSRVYKTITDFSKIVVFVLKDYSDFKENTMCFSEEQVTLYLQILQKIGFKFSWQDGKITVSSIEHDCYAIEIPITENSNISVLLLLNLTRYLYETTGPEVLVKPFMKISSLEQSSLDLWNNMMMVHYDKNLENSGHAITSWGKFIIPYTEDQLQKQIIKNKAKVNQVESYLNHKLLNRALTVEEMELMKAAFESKDRNKVLEQYKKLINTNAS